MFKGLFGQRSAKIAQLEVRLEAQQALIEKLDSQLEELKALKENIASLHETALERTFETLNSTATADLIGEVRSAIVNDPSFATDLANDMVETVSETVGENLDYDDIASRVSINYSELASEVEMYSLAQEIDVSEIEIDYDELNIDHDEISIDLEALAETLDINEIASQININAIIDAIIDAIDLKELMNTSINQLPQVILDATTDRREEAEGDWTELEWSVLMVVRKAIAELAES